MSTIETNHRGKEKGDKKRKESSYSTSSDSTSSSTTSRLFGAEWEPQRTLKGKKKREKKRKKVVMLSSPNQLDSSHRACGSTRAVELEGEE